MSPLEYFVIRVGEKLARIDIFGDLDKNLQFLCVFNMRRWDIKDFYVYGLPIMISSLEVT